jgi:hypothetical protein
MYFILIAAEATNFDSFKSHVKNINYVIHFNPYDKFVDDYVVTVNKFGTILIVTLLFAWSNGTNNGREKT